MSRAFTAMELLVSVAIILLLATVTVVQMRSYTQRQQFDAEANEVHRSLIEQRSRSAGAENDKVHGVRFATTSMVVFEGVAAATSTASTTFSFGMASIRTALTGNTKELTFNKLTGAPTATGTIDIYNASLVTTTTITIYASGLIEKTQ
jgi:type II secretory pathway pseudopilin PulG